jgi:hypothetical protein
MAHTLVVIGREFHTVLNDEVKRCVQSLKSQGIAIQTVAKTKRSPYTIWLSRDQLQFVIIRFRERNAIATEGKKMDDLKNSANAKERLLHNLYCQWIDWSAGIEEIEMHL